MLHCAVSTSASRAATLLGYNTRWDIYMYVYKYVCIYIYIYT